MIIKKEDLKKYELKKDKKINIFNIDSEIKNLISEKNKKDIKSMIEDIIFFIEEEEKRKIIKEYLRSLLKNLILCASRMCMKKCLYIFLARFLQDLTFRVKSSHIL